MGDGVSGAARLFVNEKEAGVNSPTAAVTTYLPTVALAVRDDEMAMPWLLVAAVFVKLPPLKLALAPLKGALKVTDAFGMGLPYASFTVAANGAPNAVSTIALWGVPPVAVIEAAGPGVFVSAKLAAVLTPAAEVVT